MSARIVVQSGRNFAQTGKIFNEIGKNQRVNLIKLFEEPVFIG
jgi:hypothetical protein